MIELMVTVMVSVFIVAAAYNMYESWRDFRLTTLGLTNDRQRIVATANLAIAGFLCAKAMTWAVICAVSLTVPPTLLPDGRPNLAVNFTQGIFISMVMLLCFIIAALVWQRYNLRHLPPARSEVTMRAWEERDAQEQRTAHDAP